VWAVLLSVLDAVGGQSCDVGLSVSPQTSPLSGREQHRFSRDIPEDTLLRVKCLQRGTFYVTFDCVVLLKKLNL
jgi:hypothetical protein